MTDTTMTDSPATSRKTGGGGRTRRAGFPKKTTVAIQIALIIVVLIGWELASGTVVDELLISRPSEIFPQLWEWVASGELLGHASSTFTDALMGLLAGGLAGLAVGCVLGQSEHLSGIFEPFITALYTMPKHALIPLFIMWVGIGSELRVLTAASIVFFLFFYNTFFGIRDVSRSLIESVRVMGGGSGDVMFRVMLPSAMVWVVAALKLAVPQSIVGVVVAEMLAGDHGLGFLVAKSAGSFDSSGTFAAIFALLVAGFVVDRVVTLATRRALLWKEAN